MIIKKITLDGALYTNPLNINNIADARKINIDLLNKLFRDSGVVANIKAFDEVLPVSINGSKLIFNVLIDITPQNYKDITLTKLEGFLNLNGFSFTGNVYIESK